mmetsp:Transcript_2392/g.3397  ORF Transcript_2392/g.3397 Transcript_2392/m.3397 type:complete len:292 (+) Transcript_2392:38-913(+)
MADNNVPTTADSSTCCSNPCRSIYKVVFYVTRLILLAYAVFGILSYFETRELLKSNEFMLDGTTLYFPLVLCIPNEISISGVGQEDVSSTASGVSGCEKLDFLINSTAAGLILSTVATVIFLIIDFMARRKRGPFNSSSAAGMMLYLTIILVQTGISVGALLEQNKFWTKTYELLLSGGGFFDNQGITKVESYANRNLLIVSVILAFVAAFFILLDTIIYKCFEKPAEDRHSSFHTSDASSRDKETADIMAKQAADIESSTQGLDASNKKRSSSSRVSKPDSPSWASPQAY